MTQPYALTIKALQSLGYDLAEQLGFDELNDALAVSIFEAGDDGLSVQALYEEENAALRVKASLPKGLEVSLTQLPDEDWVGLSQSGLPPIRAGRFFVHGSHDTPPDEAEFPILVDAGQAFGTGHHGTTKGCLIMLDQMDQEGLTPQSILDLGTGAGILAIAAAKLFPDADILATDIDPIAVDVALENAALNDVTYRAIRADGFQSPELNNRQFDLVIANILAGPLRGLAEPITKATKPGGSVILSGILDEQAEWVAGAFRDQGLNIAPQKSVEGWTSLLAHRPKK